MSELSSKQVKKSDNVERRGELKFSYKNYHLRSSQLSYQQIVFMIVVAFQQKQVAQVIASLSCGSSTKTDGSGYCIPSLGPGSSQWRSYYRSTKTDGSGYCIPSLGPGSSQWRNYYRSTKTESSGYCIHSLGPGNSQ